MKLSWWSHQTAETILNNAVRYAMNATQNSDVRFHVYRAYNKALRAVRKRDRGSK